MAGENLRDHPGMTQQDYNAEILRLLLAGGHAKGI